MTRSADGGGRTGSWTGGAGALGRAAVAAAVVLLPFNSVPWFGRRLGELSYEGWVLGGGVLVGVWLLQAGMRGSIRYPRSASAYLLLGWLGWVALTSAGHLAFGNDLEFKGRTLLEKVSLQVALATFVVLVALASYWALASLGNGTRVLERFRRYIWVSLVLPLVWAAVEAAVLIIPDGPHGWLLNVVGQLVHSKADYEARLRSVSGEASWFGVWLTFALPWAASAALQSGRLTWAVVLMLGSVTVLTFSRVAWTGFALVSGGFTVSYAWLMAPKRLVKRVLALLGGLVVLVGLATVADAPRARAVLESATLDPANPHWISNSSRLGMQVAALRMGISSPVTGVGWGASGFHFGEFLPEWARNPETEEYLANIPETPWPSVHGLWARLVGETGLIGFGLFAAAWALFLREAWRRARRAAQLGDQNGGGLWLALFWSAVGCLLVGFALDSLRFGGYWFLLGTGWAALKGGEPSGTDRK